MRDEIKGKRARRKGSRRVSSRLPMKPGGIYIGLD